jgi:hypothetical protein
MHLLQLLQIPPPFFNSIDPTSMMIVPARAGVSGTLVGSCVAMNRRVQRKLFAPMTAKVWLPVGIEPHPASASRR